MFDGISGMEGAAARLDTVDWQGVSVGADGSGVLCSEKRDIDGITGSEDEKALGLGCENERRRGTLELNVSIAVSVSAIGCTEPKQDNEGGWKMERGEVNENAALRSGGDEGFRVMPSSVEEASDVIACRVASSGIGEWWRCCWTRSSVQELGLPFAIFERVVCGVSSLRGVDGSG